MLSLMAIGMPCSGPRIFPCRRSRSRSSASLSAFGFIEITAFSLPLYSAIRVRYCCVSSREVTRFMAMARCMSAMDASTTLKGFLGFSCPQDNKGIRRKAKSRILCSVALGAAALVLPEVTLAKPDGLRGDLDQLVIAYELYRVFERQGNRRGEVDRLVLARGADVGELLCLYRIYDEVVVAGIGAHEHALVHRIARADEH